MFGVWVVSGDGTLNMGLATLVNTTTGTCGTGNSNIGVVRLKTF